MVYDSYVETHLSYKEIEKTQKEVLKHKKEIIKMIEEANEIILFGCGSSYWCALSIAKSLNARTHKFAQAFKATEASMHLNELKNKFNNPVFLIPSRSGASQELLITVKKMKEFYPNSKILLLSEYLDNELEKISDYNISLPWANEISVCQTRSFDSLYSGLLMIVSMVANDDTLNKELSVYLKGAKLRYLKMEEIVKQLISKHEKMEVVTLGSGVAYGVVIEGAYIIVEMAQEKANFYQTLEYRHGPIVCTNKNTIVFLLNTNSTNEKLEIQMAREIKEKGGKVVLIGFKKDVESYTNFTLDEYSEEIKGLYFVSILQMVAYHLALKKGLNPDKPGDLVKFIQY